MCPRFFPRSRLAALSLALGLLACGGEPPPLPPILDVVDVLVQDDFLNMADCAQLRGLELRGRVRISGVAATCGLTVPRDGLVLSICGDVPAKQPRELTIEYVAKDAVGDLVVVVTEQTLDLTEVRKSPVSLDLSKVEVRAFPDEDDDGASNLEELCVGADPRS